MEKLYNNIILPDDFASAPSDPENVPYLKNPPEVINVSVGRQLFIDDFLIDRSDLTPVYHDAVKFDGNPVLKPEARWERDGAGPAACPKSGGVWYDAKEKLFKMWYEAGWLDQMCYAYSQDGIEWIRPDLGDGTNRILKYERRPKDGHIYDAPGFDDLLDRRRRPGYVETIQDVPAESGRPHARYHRYFTGRRELGEPDPDVRGVRPVDDIL